jgi:hypothetical protein
MKDANISVKQGSRWSGGDGKNFIVLGTMLIEGKSWVHYRLEKPLEHMPNEFSCYLESFVQRFTQQAE